MNTARNWTLLHCLPSYPFAVKWLAIQERKTPLPNPHVETDIEQIKRKEGHEFILEYNSISYFIYKGQRLGFEYELMQHLHNL